MNIMAKVIKPKHQPDNFIEVTQGDTFQHYGKGDQRVDKRIIRDGSFIKKILVAALGLIIGTAVLWWLAKLIGFAPLILQ